MEEEMSFTDWSVAFVFGAESLDFGYQYSNLVIPNVRVNT